MLRKLFVTGRTLAIGVPEEAARQVGFAAGDYVDVEIDREAAALVIWPASHPVRQGVRDGYRAQVAAYLADYGPALAALQALDTAADRP